MSMIDDAMGALQGGMKGAAVGAALGPIGAAAGGLLGVAFNAVPGLQHLIVGNEDTIARVENVVQAVTGTSDPAQAQAVLDADPDGIKADLQRQLAEIAADRFKAQLADVANARSTTVQLASVKSGIAWGSAIVSGVLLAAWLGSIIANYFSAPALGADDAATLRNLAIAVAGYWVGSSAGSASKDARLANSVPAQMLSKPLTSEPK